MPHESMRRLAIPGGWTETSIELRGRSLSLLVPADPDKFLDHLDGHQPPLHICDPYWARLWPTALAMADLVARESWPANLWAIELGCGIGVVGLAALVSGLQVTFTDHVPEAVDLACENARRNRLTNFTGCVVNWRSPPSDRYPLILASDVLYDATIHDTLLDLLDATLAPNGTCWIGDPGRFHCEAFFHAARDRGYRISMRDQQGQDLNRIPAGHFCLFVIRRACE